MRTALSAVVALASTLQVASAGWTDASSFSCPSNTDNHCSSQQSGGFDWGSLNLGSFSEYGGFSFEGFSCDSSFGGSAKRDALTGRSFQQKCITGHATSDHSSAPSFSCGGSSGVSAFSVDEFQVSVEFDCSLEFHYGMSDGSTCKQTSYCKQSGSTVKNTQCGGAKNVSIVYPPQSAGGGKSSCSIGFHSIGFDCSSASKTVYHSSTTTTHTQETSAHTTPASSAATTTSVPPPPETSPSSTTETTPATSATVETTSSSTTETTPPTSVTVETTSSSSTETTPPTSATVETTSSSSAETTPPTSPAAQSSTVVSTTVLISTSTFFSTSISTIISCGPEVTSCPARSTVISTILVPTSTTVSSVTTTETIPVSIQSSTSSSVEIPPTSAATSTTVIITTPPITPPATSSPPAVETSTTVSEVITTEIVYTSTTLCPVTATQVTNGVTTTSVGVSVSTVLITSTSTICTVCEASATESSPPPPTATAPCPDILPQCLNTWLFSTGCESNTDSDCYCSSSSFVSIIFDCLSAHGASDEIASAQTYFQGICAAYVPGNPAIITAASAVTAGSGGAVPTSVPVTTVQILTTLVVPCTQTTGISSGSIIPGSSITSVLSTAITVPQVQFTTVGGGATTGAALVAATTGAGGVAGGAAATTFSSVGVSNATITGPPAGTSAVPFTGAASRNSMVLGSVGAAVLLAVLAM